MGDETIAQITEKKKSHRDRNSGRKAAKKKSKNEAQNPVLQEVSDKQRNPKAFAFNSAIRAERRFRRKQDIETKKQHIPLVDRTAIEPPPILIAIVGPPKVGKSTLINNLIKLFTKCPLTDIQGPVTVVSGKKRRITLVECNNDINSMIDLAKVADLVLLMCDASFGFEMEIFEFLNICQVHGMPRIMGILTHLDMIKNNKALKNTKKTLKHRFWTEVYAGAKLFYLSGILHKEYLRNEIKNLGRFISVMKFRPLAWRLTHSYLIGDRYEDLTNLEDVRQNPNCDRVVSLYGYVRGVPLKKDTFVHIAGLGDLKMRDISYLPDPCPLPEQIKKRALIEKERLIYAPFSGVGGIVYDKDAVYLELAGSHSHNKQIVDDESDDIAANMNEAKETIDTKLENSEWQLFSGEEKIIAKNFEVGAESVVENVPLYEKNIGKEVSDLEEELRALRKRNIKTYDEEKVEDSGRTRRRVIFDMSDEEFEKSVGVSEDSDDSESDDEEQKIEEKIVMNKKEDSRHKISDALKSLRKKEEAGEVDEHSSEDEGDSEVEETEKEETEENSDDSESDEAEQKSVENIVVNKQDHIHDKISSVLKNLEKKHEMSKDESSSEDDSEVDETEEKGSDEDAEDEDVESSVDEHDLAVKWKENLTRKAQDSFLTRQNSSQNLMKLVYGQNKTVPSGSEQEEASENGDDIADFLRGASSDQQIKKMEKDTMNSVESSLSIPWNVKFKNYLEPENKMLIVNCFVTGKWKESEDAGELLKLDDAELSDDSEIFGDFEDLETEEKHEAKPQAKKRKLEEPEGEEKNNKEELAEKKRKLKEKFDAEYDNTENTSYYDDLKMSAEKQSQLNKSVFENMDDHLRVQIEGFRPGMYVRIELEQVPAEFINNFDPTYPIIIGALNMGEENVGYVNVRLKKHRWYKKILKSSDPLIVSLGWRRFQTLPLFSKLEDDLKYRYLKYTPEHISCNGHFWGPITPQGSGFLALQSCDSNPDILKQQGFRIVATGVVQELDKSTQVMKKLKLIGYPMKIYKKTAFIKGMFNSSLEVAKFEGARIKTVSGIRGQIKKAASKPEGCFRATFEDKIQLSDIVFCRTLYKVDVPRFYSPVTTLLLPQDKKNSWKGVRTVGELKRDKGIKIEPNTNSLYTPIVREPKVFKPFVVPKKLQQALPYRDKSKYGVKAVDKKKGTDRVAVIREPHEQKITDMIKMIKVAYEHKQQQIKQATKERLEKHKQTIEAQENMKNKKINQKKKEVFRAKSKAQIRAEKKGTKSSS